MPSFSFPIGSILKVGMICKIPGQISVNTLKFQMVDLIGASSFGTQNFLTDLATDMSALMAPLLSNSAELYGLNCYLMNPIGPAPRPDDTGPLGVAGTAGAGLMPAQTSGLISWYTALLGKHGQGRMYVPFPAPASNQSDGTPTAGYVTALGDLSSSLRTLRTVVDGPVTASFQLCIYIDPLAGPHFVVDATERDAWATQRRRGAFGRANNPPF